MKTKILFNKIFPKSEDGLVQTDLIGFIVKLALTEVCAVLGFIFALLFKDPNWMYVLSSLTLVGLVFLTKEI